MTMSFREGILAVFKEILQTALISLGIFFFVYILLVQPHRVKGDSMFPNFIDGELLLTEKVTYRLFKPKRGDVIVFKAPTLQKVDFIKRIIGLPHDNVKIENGTIFINGIKIEEPYETQSTEGSINILLSDNQYYVLGDNRQASSDSRAFGAIERKSIKGKSWLVYWPIFTNQKYKGTRFISGVDYGIPDTLQN